MRPQQTIHHGPPKPPKRCSWLEAGDLFCPESTRYLSFEDDLISEDTLADKDARLPQVGLAEATTPIKQQLAVLRDVLTARFEAVNASIRAGNNRFVQIKHGQTVWARRQDAEAPAEHEPLFDVVERIDIDQLLLHVDRQTDFLAASEHGSAPSTSRTCGTNALASSPMPWCTTMAYYCQKFSDRWKITRMGATHKPWNGSHH